MQAGGDTNSGQWLLFLKPLADQAEHRHFLLSPFDPALTCVGQTQVLYVMLYCHVSSPLFGLIKTVRGH
jgi:hypothetical protein